MNPLEQYISDLSSPEEALLKEVTRTTYLKTIHPQMLSGHVQGRLLEMIVRMLRPQRILEIGTFTGYSTLSMAAGLDSPDARIDTIEADDELQSIIQSHFDRSPRRNQIRLHIGSALLKAPQLGEVYDLVFVDGDKREYPAYLDMLLNGAAPHHRPLVRAGSFILADNILWYGKVAEPAKYSDPHTRAIVEFNRLVLENPHLENVILPLRDGINLIRVIDLP